MLRQRRPPGVASIEEETDTLPEYTSSHKTFGELFLLFMGIEIIKLYVFQYIASPSQEESRKGLLCSLIGC